jgi:hypothetical protein
LSRAAAERSSEDDAELEAERRRFAERERFIAAREAALAEREQEVETGPPVAPVPIDVTARSRAFEEQERELLLREARIEADHDIREEKLERREAIVVAREEKLRLREGDLSTYVAQVQDDFGRRETEWWGRQLGQPLEVAGS